MTPPDPLAAAGLEPPPKSPFAAPDDPAAAQPVAPEPPEPFLNRAARRSMRHARIADVRLLARVVRYDLAHQPAPSNPNVPAPAVYPTELAATYGLERAAKAMRLKGLLTRAEQAKVQMMARGRRAALKP